MEPIQRDGNQSGNRRTLSLSCLYPRIWKLMILAAYPFLIFSATYFEALERRGTVEALIADTLMPMTLLGYAAIIVVLKKRSL